MVLRNGDVFGRWTVISEQAIGKGTNIKYLCRCSCARKTQKYVRAWNLINGDSKSCGCLTSEKTRERRKTHGETNTRLYTIWLSMKARCSNPNNNRHNRYGGRGIKVCQKWDENFLAFKEWALSNGYQDNLSIDRIDNNGNYEPDNCRWSTNKEQCNNRSTNIVIKYNGVEKTATEWGEELGIDTHTIIKRYKQHKPLDEVFAKNLKDVVIEFDGERHTISEWSKITGIKHSTIWSRYNRGLSVDDVLFQGKLNDKRAREREVV